MVKKLYNGPPLRSWQIEAIKRWNVSKKGIIQAVPGAGKTFFAIKLFCDVYEQDKDVKILIVCPRLSLIEQWKNVILENSAFKEKDIYEISSNNDVKAHKKAQELFHKSKIFISTFNQIKQFFSFNEWKKQKWFLIVDEMHNTTEGFKFPEQIEYKLGLSATPKKKGKQSDFNLGGIIFTYTFEMALNDKIILEPVFKLILYSVEENVFKKIQDNKSTTNELLDEAYDSILNDKKEDSKNNSLVFTEKNTDFIGIQKILEQKFKIEDKDSQKSLIFVNRIKKANLLNTILSKKFDKQISHSHHSQSENYSKKGNFNTLRKNFEKGKFKVLISVNALGEGIDFPYASQGIIASPIYNPTNFIQKVGRLLRTYQNHKQAVIYYYIPSELISKILTDERISPNYLKSVLKIASDRKKLFFVDRETLEETPGDFADLFIQGAAYERNSEIKMLKVPSNIDLILRFSKKLFPESFKHWRTYCEENDFSKLEEKIIGHSKILLRCANTLLKNMKQINILQKEFLKDNFADYDSIKDFVRIGVKKGFIIKIKYGVDLLENPNASEKELLQTTISAELIDFVKKYETLSKQIKILEKNINSFEKANQSNKISVLQKIAKTFFDLQSNYLDQLDLIKLTKSFEEDEKIIVTFGKDIFIMSNSKKVFAYPEDMGLSRWKMDEEEKIEEKIPQEEFVKELLDIEKLLGEKNILTKQNFEILITEISTRTNSKKYSKKEIIELLENAKHNRNFSLVKIFFVIELIKKIK
ncbi:MAG: DEAD/DEAH box helicase family protein [Candidatus ainarchaeum sp.]|nr:DEAD/DEAH box helicase family protein [Candidatus ainarchaeum sp.]